MASTPYPQRMRCRERALAFLFPLRQHSVLVLLATSLLFVMKVCGQSYQFSIRDPEGSEISNFRRNDQDLNLINIGPLHGQAALGLGYLYNDNAAVTTNSRLSLNENL